jgi:hypothetical protein
MIVEQVIYKWYDISIYHFYIANLCIRKLFSRKFEIYLFTFFLYRTLTTPVELIRCLRSIKEHAFVASEYPVVITLEDHLTPDLQAKVAEVS